MTATRRANGARPTKETEIDLELVIDGRGQAEISTGIGFYDHMLTAFALNARFDLRVTAKGDLHVSQHHTVEDVGIVLGQAFAEAVGDKRGIRRYGHAYVPLDEALSRVVVDFSGRPGLEYHVTYPRARIGDFDVDLIQEFFQGFCNHALVSLHVDCLRGRNAHHIAETVFKAFGRALRMALEPDPRMGGSIPSTKGAL